MTGRTIATRTISTRAISTRPDERRSHRLRLAATVAALGVTAASLTACGDRTAGAAAPETVPETEPATMRGLAAAVYSHLGEEELTGLGGYRQEQENWMLASAKVDAGDLRVPLDTMVLEDRATAEESAQREKGCEEELKNSWILRCDDRTAPDGSAVQVLASTEDLTGGRLSEGFVLFVVNFREDDEVVLVMQQLPSRKAEYLDMTGLPVDVDVLVEIVTDPLVGFETTPELNAAGEQIEGFRE
jgi:hypothetical protein